MRGQVNNHELRAKVMDVVQCDFQELKPILATVAHSGKESHSLKIFDEELDADLHCPEEIEKQSRDALKQLEAQVKKAANAGFYKVSE